MRDSEQVRACITRFWQLMQGSSAGNNDFSALVEVLAEDFVCEWPQSRERIRGAQNFIRMNNEYPAHGPWHFNLQQMLVEGEQAVTSVAINDGVQFAHALSFFTVKDGKITYLREYWPEPFSPGSERGHLVEKMDE